MLAPLCLWNTGITEDIYNLKEDAENSGCLAKATVLMASEPALKL